MFVCCLSAQLGLLLVFGAASWLAFQSYNSERSNRRHKKLMTDSCEPCSMPIDYLRVPGGKSFFHHTYASMQGKVVCDVTILFVFYGE